jgi:hypothetical protein
MLDLFRKIKRKPLERFAVLVSLDVEAESREAVIELLHQMFVAGHSPQGRVTKVDDFRFLVPIDRGSKL